MNRSFRQVWSAARGAYIIAPETARGNGKAGRAVRSLRPAAVLATAVLANGALAQGTPATTVVPTTGATTAYVSANGVPVVNIATANAAGLSHNQFNRYDVDSKGLVLNNNSFSSAAVLQSQLAGQVVGNMNLSAQAKVILNEVVSNQRSTLAGFTEVLGGKADVIVANQYGITCNGCGFINSDRATLTTGVPFLGADGAVGGFRVTMGDVLINGAGLNASAQQILDIVTRTVRIDGQVNTAAGGELSIVAGANEWSYAGRNVTAGAVPEGAVPSYAIDSSALGGMYAGRIRLIATEAGVGVRMLGEAAAGAGDFDLDAAGKVEIHGRISAANDIALRQTGATGAALVELAGADAALTAARAVTIAAEGGVRLDEGSIKAGADLNLRAESLADSSGAGAARSAAAIDVALTGDASLDGTSWGADGRLAFAAGRDLLASGAKLHSGGAQALAADGDLGLAGTKLTSTDTLAMRAGAGLSIDAATEANAAADATLVAATGMDNAGKLLAGAGLRVDGAAGMNVSNSGLMQAKNGLAIGQDAALALTNAASGKLLGDTVAVAATDIDNAGIVQGTNGVELAASGAQVNRAGALILTTAAGKDVVLSGAGIDNAGRVQSAGALKAGAADDIVNSGELLTTGADAGGADGALALSADTLDNSGLAVAAGLLDIDAGSLTNSRQLQGESVEVDAATGFTNLGSAAVLLAQTRLALRAGTLDNQGAMQAGASLKADVDAEANNAGTIEALGAGGTLSLSSAALVNSGTVRAGARAELSARTDDLFNSGLVTAAKIELEAGKALANRGQILADDEASVRSASVDNGGRLQAGSLLDIVATDAILNSGTLQTTDSRSELLVSGAGIETVGTIQAQDKAELVATAADIVNGGSILAGDDVALQAKGDILTRIGSKIMLDGALDLSAENLDNRGLMQAEGAIEAEVAGEFVNVHSVLALGKRSDILVRAGLVRNNGTLQSGAATSLATLNGGLGNTGKILAGTDLTMDAAIDLVNSGEAIAGGAMSVTAIDVVNRGTLQSDGSLEVTTRKTIDNSGLVLMRDAEGTLALEGAAIKSRGTIESAGAGLLRATTGAIANSGAVSAAEVLDIDAAKGLSNDGAGARVIGGADVFVSGDAGFSVVNDGRIQAGGELGIGAQGQAAGQVRNATGATLFGAELALHGGSVTNQGRIQAMGDAVIEADSLTNRGSGAVLIFGIEGGDALLSVRDTLRNEGALHSGGNLDIDAGGVKNTNTAGISSLSDTTIIANVDGIDNAGALYADGVLTATAFDQRVTNTSSGTMDASRIAISAGTFTNYNTVISTDTTDITTTVAFKNLPTGGVPNIVTERIDYDGVTTPHDSGDYNCNIFGAACDRIRVYAQNYRVVQGLDGPMPTQKGEIIAGRTINIRYGASGANTASLISAPNINISGSGTFVNEDLHLEEISYARRWRDYKTDSTFGSEDHEWTFPTSAAELGNCNDGGCYSGHASDGGSAADSSFQLETGRRVIKKWRAGIYATNLNFDGGGLMNLGSPYKEATSATSGDAAEAVGATPTTGSKLTPANGSSLNLKGGATAKPGGASLTVNVAAANGIVFEGLNLTLPTNPNGYFVPSKNPTSDFLVETNPLYEVGSNSVGSDYLSKLLGLDPEKQLKRLGDSNYEAKLVRDQLIAQTGNNIIKGMESEAAQIQALMDQAGNQSKALGLVFGQPLSKEQTAGLTEDIVWMVEQVVGGQKVLAPVVYLASSTREAIENGGPVISATNANIKAGTLTNTGGTIAGDTLAIETKGDLRNTGGTIKGGDVSVKSTEGSIINETVAETNGGKDFARTVIGAAGSIQSTGNLSLDAAKDITVKGAEVKAGGDASLAAGGAVTVDTIQDKSVDSSYKASQGLWGLSGKSESSRTATTTNIGSTLETGGNLTVKSGGDTTIAGSNVKVGGDLGMDAGGDVNIVSRQDTVEQTTSSSRSGLGVGGGLYGKTTTDTDSFKGRNAGSTLEVGGNADIASKGTLTLQGSKMKVGGDAAIAAGDVQVLAGQDVDRTTTTTSTTSFLKISGEGKADSGAGADSYAGSAASASNKNGAAQASAGAGAGASAGASASASANAGLTLAETTTTNTYDYKSRAVGSELDIGGNLKVDSKKDIVLQGATVDAGGDVDLKAQKDVKILASQDVDISTSKTTTTSIGLFVESENKASAGAEASASASAGASSDRYGSAAGANAQASARAGAEASSDTNIDLVRSTTTENSSLDITNTGTTINAGGKLKVDAGNALTVQGSDIGGEQGVQLEAKDMSFLAAEDVSVSTSKTTKTAAGLYISGSASAEAGASASASANASNDSGGAYAGASAGAEAGASAEAKLGAGIQARHSTESSVEGSTTAKVSTIRSGSGNIERNATGKILDVGTAIEAGGDFSQSADTIESRAARNTTFSSSESQSDSMRLGVYAKAGAEAKASASAEAQAGSGLLGPLANSGTSNESGAGANASVGVEAQYAHESSSSSSSSSEAVVSTIKTGGKVTSKSTGKTTFEGTRIAGDGGVDLEAGSIDFKAATNTETSSEKNLNVNAAANVGLNLGSDGLVDGGVSGGFENGSGTASSSTAVVGSIQSGAGLNIKTSGDARFEGTDIGAAGDATVAAGGKLTFDAARNESSESGKSANAEVSIAVSKSNSGKEAGIEAGGGFENTSSRSSEAVTGTIASGGNLTLSSGKDMKFEGTTVQGGGDTTIEAGGNVDFAAARNTSSSDSVNASASLSLSGGSSSDKDTGASEKSRSGAFGAEGGYAKERSSEAVTGALESGGNLKIKSGGSTTFEGTDIAAGGAASVDAGGDVSFKAAESTSSSFGVAASVGMEGSNTTTTPGKAPAAGAGAAAMAAGLAKPEPKADAEPAGPETEETRSGSVGFELGSSSASEKKGAAIKAGSIDINAGRNASFEGTQVAADGDVNVAAKGDVSVTTARSTSSNTGVSLSGQRETTSKGDPAAASSSTSAGIGLELGSSSTHGGATFESGGKVSVSSGGRATLVNAEVKADGGQEIKAAGGVVRSTVTDTESGLRLNASGAAETAPKEAAPEPAAGAAAAAAKPAQQAEVKVEETQSVAPAKTAAVARPVVVSSNSAKRRAVEVAPAAPLPGKG